MRAGQNGRVAISWTQTELDGLEAAPLAFLVVGAAWSWRGAVAASEQEGALVKIGNVNALEAMSAGQSLGGAYRGTVTLSNGAQSFSADLMEAEYGLHLVFEGECPPRDQDFWISDVVSFQVQTGSGSADETVIAFPAQHAR